MLVQVVSLPNKVEDCDQVLQRTGWMASFQEWGDQLNLTHEPPHLLSYWAVHSKTSRNNSSHKPDFDRVTSNIHWVDDTFNYAPGYHRNVMFPYMLGHA